MGTKPVIVQHCFGELGHGGPIAGLQLILQSDLAHIYNLKTCLQERPAGGVNIPLIFQMARCIRTFRPDLLHVCGLQNEGFHGLLAGRLAGCKLILVAVHGFAGDIRYPEQPIRQKIVSNILEPFTLRHADGVFCVSEFASKRSEITKNARRSLGFIHNAVEIPDHCETNIIVRKTLGLTENDIVLICVCRMTREKGIFDLYDAIEILDKKVGFPIKLLLVGDGPALSVVQKIDSLLINITIIPLGKRFDVPELLGASDLFVFPSLHENLSYAILEAMSFALPVIATRVGGNPEVVIDGETGHLIPPSNPEALSDSILSLLSDPGLMKKMGVAGRQRIEQKFSMPVLVENLDRIYQNMLNL